MKGLNYLLIIYGLLIGISCTSTPKQLTSSAEELEQHQFAQLDSLMKQEQRPVAVFLHTSWCKFCKNMERTTFRDESVIKLLNEKYYFISFDGEQKEAVTFRNHIFKFQPTGKTTGMHELAIALGTIDKELAYPSFVLLNPEYEIVFQHNAFMKRSAMRKILEEGVKG